MSISKIREVYMYIDTTFNITNHTIGFGFEVFVYFFFTSFSFALMILIKWYNFRIHDDMQKFGRSG